MTPGQTATGAGTGEHSLEVSGLVAEMQNKALTSVQRLLKPHGLRSVRARTIRVRLRGDRLLWPDATLARHASELTVYADTGPAVATVVMGRRASNYLVSLPTLDVECRAIGADEPGAVVDMILEALPKEAA